MLLSCLKCSFRHDINCLLRYVSHTSVLYHASRLTPTSPLLPTLPSDAARVCANAGVVARGSNPHVSRCRFISIRVFTGTLLMSRYVVPAWIYSSGFADGPTCLTNVFLNYPIAVSFVRVVPGTRFNSATMVAL
jgi:hypothetical protein